jgi:hypothetical protein
MKWLVETLHPCVDVSGLESFPVRINRITRMYEPELFTKVTYYKRNIPIPINTQVFFFAKIKIVTYQWLEYPRNSYQTQEEAQALWDSRRQLRHLDFRHRQG